MYKINIVLNNVHFTISILKFTFHLECGDIKITLYHIYVFDYDLFLCETWNT